MSTLLMNRIRRAIALLGIASMNWEGLSAAELCRSASDKAKHGGRDHNALAVRLTTDPIVHSFHGMACEPVSTRLLAMSSKANNRYNRRHVITQ